MTLSENFFAAAMPGLIASVRDGTFKSFAATAVANTLIEKLFPKCDCAFLFGSTSRNEQKEFSDLDILVVIPEVPAPQKRCFIYQGFPVELHLYDRRHLVRAIEDAWKTAKPHLLFSILEGKTLRDDSHFAFELAQLAREAFSKTPPRLDDISLINARVNITSAMVELSSNKDQVEVLIYAARLYEVIATIFLWHETGWQYSLKWVPRKLREYFPNIAIEFDSGLEAIGKTRDCGQFLGACETLLMKLGGPVWHGFTAPLISPGHPNAHLGPKGVN